MLSVGMVFSCNIIILQRSLQLQIFCVCCVLEKCEPTLPLFTHQFCLLSESNASLSCCATSEFLHFVNMVIIMWTSVVESLSSVVLSSVLVTDYCLLAPHQKIQLGLLFMIETSWLRRG